MTPFLQTQNNDERNITEPHVAIQEVNLPDLSLKYAVEEIEKEEDELKSLEERDDSSSSHGSVLEAIDRTVSIYSTH